jgi:hypothetical protein
MSEVAPIIDIIEKLTASSESNNTERTENFLHLDSWITEHLKGGRDDALFSVAGRLSKEQQSFFFSSLQSNIDYHPMTGGEAFVFGIPLFFSTPVDYELIKQHEDNIIEECLQQMANSGIFHSSCLVSSLGFLSDMSQHHSIKPSVLYSISAYLSLTEKLQEQCRTKDNYSLPAIDEVTKGFRLLQDRDRCLLLGAAYRNYNSIDFGVVMPGSAEFEISSVLACKKISRTISEILDTPCHATGLRPFSLAVNEIMTGCFTTNL